jgi:hypothetical protein
MSPTSSGVDSTATSLALRLVFHQTLLVDSAGLKIYSEGECLDRKHGILARRR